MLEHRLNKREELELKHLWLDRLTVQAKLLQIKFTFRLIETGVQSISLPDIFFVHNGRSGWLEFKVTHNIEHPTVRYEPGQRVELRNLWNSGVFAATVGVTTGMDFILASAPRVLCNTSSNLYNLDSSPIKVKGYIEDVNEGMEWMLKRYYG